VTHVTVALHFEVNSLLIDAGLAGTTTEFEFNGHKCALTMPGPEDWPEPEFGAFVLSRCMERDGVPINYYAQILHVKVQIESRLAADNLPSGGPSSPANIAEAKRVYDQAHKVASEIMHSYINQVRLTSDQVWLASTATMPRAVLTANLFDASGRRLAIGFGAGGVAVVRELEQVLDSPRHAAAIESISREKELELADVLLADARYTAWPTNNPDSRHSLLLAAIACEVKTKTTLYALASHSQLALVDVIISNPRDVSMAVVSLLDKALDAVCGRSLRRDNRDLYKAATQLFTDRNTIAHKGGGEIEPGRLPAHLKTAVSVFNYLNSLQSTDHP
jgi:hypothetical protein